MTTQKRGAGYAATRTAVVPESPYQGQVVQYHAPGGTDYPALVAHVFDGEAFLIPFIESGTPCQEGTAPGQWSAIV